jgi:hypothetical protein
LQYKESKHFISPLLDNSICIKIKILRSAHFKLKAMKASDALVVQKRKNWGKARYFPSFWGIMARNSKELKSLYLASFES